MCTGHEALHVKKTKIMKKYIAKLAVIACVAMFALNSQSQAAGLHISFSSGKVQHCCVHEHRPVVKHKVSRHHCAQCCKPHKMDKRRRPVVHNRKEVGRHGR